MKDTSNIAKIEDLRFRFLQRISVDASRAKKRSDENDVLRQRRARRFSNARDESIRRGKERYEQKRLI